MSSDLLTSPLQFLKGVGPRRAADLQRAGLVTAADLLERFPLRYEDRGHVRPIASLQPGEQASIVGDVVDCGLRSTRRAGFRIFEALIKDPSGAVRAVWLNQAFLRDVVKRRQRLVLFGAVDRRPRGGLQVTNPQFEVVGEGDDADAGGGPEDAREGAARLHTGRIVPIYERIGTMTPKMQRRLVHELLQRLPAEIPDPLPETLRRTLALPDRRTALVEAHFPPADTSIDTLNRFRTPAQTRLIFEELFLFQVGLRLRRDAPVAGPPAPIVVDDRVRASARQVLPFRLTAGQRAALQEIVADLQRPRPMHRLLQGDVGSGKTLVAVLTALVTMENGLQVAFMAPTEILAEQHAVTLRRLLAPSRFRVGLLTGSQAAPAREEVLANLAGGRIDLVVGTHALVQEGVRFRALGLAIIDEQHRFGVRQRAALRDKGSVPHVLVMTATPIPRTLALTSFGDLDVSTIPDLPPGRQPVETRMEPASRRRAVYDVVGRALAAGRQAYVVYPLIEESEKVDLKAASEMADHLAHEVFPAFRVALLHGRLKPEEKETVMARFSRGEVHVLVSTTVVEVGVDVANASVIVIEHAERFGLAQLHQLRGRVGRGTHPSVCVLVYQPPLSEVARARLEAVVETTDGFALAERDLELRGPGDVLGTRQSGLPALRLSDLVRDRDLLEQASEAAAAWAAGPASAPLAEWARRHWADRFGLSLAG